MGETSARCPYCGTTFELDEENTAKAVLNFIGKQMSESREIKKELRKEEAAREAKMIKYFCIAFGCMCVLGIIAMVIMNIFDIG